MSQYKAASGLTAAIEQGALAVTWNGSNGSELRARYGIDNGQPVVRELAVRKTGGQWAPLGQNLTPEFYVKSGVRRMTTQQGAPLRDLGVDITSEVIEKNKWYAFWDAPFVDSRRARAARTRRGSAAQAPARGADNPDRRRRASRRREEERASGTRRTRVWTAADARRNQKADATFKATRCSVKTDGARVEVNFPGLSMGIFSGSLQFTSYRGSNLLRMEAIAKTDQQSVAYKYEGGLRGFSTSLTPQVSWRDRGGDPQQYEFGGIKNDARVTVKAKNRVLVAGGGKSGSIATFTPPHVFFFTREVDTNLGYIWYRKDGDTQFGMGVRQAEGEEVPEYVENFALHNAPPGTMQRMAVYYLDDAGFDRAHASGGDGLHARRRVQARPRLQDDGEPFPPAVHPAPACIGIARQYVRGSHGDALRRHQHRRVERLPRRSASERSGAGTVRGSEATTTRRR